MKVSKIVPTHRLATYDVINPDGKDLGQVQEIMLDMAQGRIAFVVVSFGGIMGLTDKWFTLPWEILEWSPGQRIFILNMPREILEQAPGIDKNKWPQEIDLSWLSVCYAHYGCAPYWESPMVTDEHVKKLAYSIWESEGQPAGKALEHYYRSERVLRDQEAKRIQPGEFVSLSRTKSLTGSPSRPK
jgi:sporulation protein YlmC with PRC-barrel domain